MNYIYVHFTTLLKSCETAPPLTNPFSNTSPNGASCRFAHQPKGSIIPYQSLYLSIDPYRHAVYGRAVNASCSTYLFPADTVESQRLGM